MSHPLSQSEREAAERQSPEQRYDYLIAKLVEHQELWILRDEQGCMLLNAEDEECIPVWPHKECALEWVNEEWTQSVPEAISLKVWLERWIPGMEEDELSIAVFPTLDEMGVVALPYEMLDSIQKKQAKRARRHE